jgi:hypothetical protein
VIQRGRFEDAEKVLYDLHGHRGAEFVAREFIEIRGQIHMEGEIRTKASFVELFSPRFLRRTGTAVLILFGSTMMGASAIQNYQSLLYAALGYEGNQILLISGIYGLMGLIGQFICLAFVADRWPRVRTMCKRTAYPSVKYKPLTQSIDTGCLSLAVLLSILMPISKFFGDGHDANGSRAGIAFIFIYSITFAIFINGMVYVLAAELFPFHLRSHGTSIAILAMSCGQILLTQVTPLAFAAITWKYYTIFISSNVTMALFYMFLLPETRGKSLEQIGESFGDRVFAHKIDDVVVQEQAAMKKADCGEIQQVEIVTPLQHTASGLK